MAAGFFERDGWQAGPGLHAFIVGISAYANLPATLDRLKPEHFGMIQLASPALTAFRIATLLKERALGFDVPVATVRLLAAPSAAELAIEPALDDSTPPDFINFSNEAKAWRADALAHPFGMTLFYFAGHGLQRVKRDHVLVLHNFNDGLGGSLANKGVVVNELFDGMAPSAGQENIARTQLYFFDTCSVQPDLLKAQETPQTGGIWDMMAVPATDDRVRPSVFASKPGALAFGKAGVETLFGGALVRCLDGGAGVPEDDMDLEASQWVVSLGSLRAALRRVIDQANREHEANQGTDAQNIDGDEIVLLRLDKRPEVDVTLRFNPDSAGAAARVSVVDEADTALRELAPLAPNQLPAGELRLRAIMEPEDAVLQPLARGRWFIRPPVAQPRLQFLPK